MKNTKRALLMSALSVLMCVSMLIGSTFAWFTDTKTVGVNKIQAGNLKVDLLDDQNESLNGKSMTWVVEEGRSQNDILWEPGCTYQLQSFRVANMGDLALRYQVIINGITGDNKLLEAIDFTVKTGESEPVALKNFSGVLLAGQKTELITITAHMKENAGNEYQGLSIDNLGITVYATQYTYENDSLGNTYDANATKEDEVVKFTFTNASDELALCAECYNKPGTDHAAHKKYVVIKDGVAKIPQAGAWLNFSDLNWADNTYVLEYDIDLTELPDGAFVAFDSGEQTNWGDVQIGFKKVDSTVTAYKTLFTTSLNEANTLGTVGNKIHAVYTYAAEGTDLNMTLTISDGTNSYKVDRVSKNINTNTALCWDVYTADGSSEMYCSIDNMVFRSEQIYSAIYNVTPDTVNDYLSGKMGSLKNAKIVLGAGNYENLVIGAPSKYADGDTVYTCTQGNGHGDTPITFTNAEEYCNHMNNGWHYTPSYTRTIENLTIVGGEGVTVAGLSISSGHAYGNNILDPVRDTIGNGSRYFMTQKLSNLTFEGISFTKKVNIETSFADTVIDGVTFDNCTFKTGSTTGTDNIGLRYYTENTNGNVRNLTVKNCKFNTCFQGIYTGNIAGVTVTGCTFDTTGHNAIAIQGGTSVNHKAVVIENNTFENIKDRIIRFGNVGADTQITIKNNTATNSGDSDGEVMKAQSLAEGITYDISGNKWGNDKTVANLELANK